MSCRMKKGPVVNFVGCNSIQGSKRILEVSGDTPHGGRALKSGDELSVAAAGQ
jgi:hypothetical protein